MNGASAADAAGAAPLPLAAAASSVSEANAAPCSSRKRFVDTNSAAAGSAVRLRRTRMMVEDGERFSAAALRCAGIGGEGAEDEEDDDAAKGGDERLLFIARGRMGKSDEEM